MVRLKSENILTSDEPINKRMGGMDWGPPSFWPQLGVVLHVVTPCAGRGWCCTMAATMALSGRSPSHRSRTDGRHSSLLLLIDLDRRHRYARDLSHFWSGRDADGRFSQLRVLVPLLPQRILLAPVLLHGDLLITMVRLVTA